MCKGTAEAWKICTKVLYSYMATEKVDLGLIYKDCNEDYS